jgi:hypothetical protein
MEYEKNALWLANWRKKASPRPFQTPAEGLQTLKLEVQSAGTFKLRPRVRTRLLYYRQMNVGGLKFKLGKTMQFQCRHKFAEIVLPSAL